MYAGVAVVILVATAVRLYGLNWDGGLGAHPDERFLVGVAEGLRWPDRLNPLEVAPGFAYGHLLPYLVAMAAGMVRGVDSLLVGRVLVALFDVGTVALTYALGRRLYGERIGLLAAAFVALMVAHVQQAHFCTVDGPVTFFTLGALLFAARLAEHGRTGDAWVAGAWAGLALGTKTSAVLFILPLGVAVAISPAWPKPGLRQGFAAAAGALATFALTNPFALISFPSFWHNVREQAALVRGALDAPYTRQFHGTWPYLYPVAQQVRWGMGWLAGLAAFGGLVYAVWRAVQEPPRRAEWVVLSWMVPSFAFVGALYVKFPRYLLPLTPVLAVYGARLLLHERRRPQPRSRLTTGDLFAVLALGGSLLRCLAFLGQYRLPHPWLAASEWFADHVPQGATVAVEQWDHPLPLDATGYEVRVLPVFDEDGPEKWARMEGAKGRNGSRNFTSWFTRSFIAGSRGSARMLRFPRARSPNSMPPWNQPTIFPPAMRRAASSSGLGQTV